MGSPREIIVWSAGIGSAVVLCALSWPSLVLLYNDWMARPEYSHGILIPLLSGYLIYARRGAFGLGGRGVGLGVLVAVAGTLVVCLGMLSTIHALSQYGFVLACIGLFYSLVGTESWRQTAVPLLLLFFMVPLPHMLHQLLSGELQLVSSEIGVAIVRLMGISVHLEGNVIDLGVYQLQVLEACDGLRYLFPLTTLSFIFAYLFRGALWQRLLLFVSAVPITILMNSVRIAIIGFTVEHWGIGTAEGFLHDFQGWSIFLVCVACLLAEARLLASLSGDRRPLVALLDVGSVTTSSAPRGGPLPVAAASSVLGLVAAAYVGLVAATPAPNAVELDRRDFVDFPLTLRDDWRGRRDRLEPRYLDELKLDDYLLANYLNGKGAFTNLYIAYYESQLSGRSVHSPRTCLPGGGWEIERLEVIEVDDGSGSRVPVNRAVIAKGPARQLVYYWFEQRGRVLADEYQVKWYLLVDSLRHGRTDGAMVRLMSPIGPGGDEAETERSMRRLFAAVRSEIPPFVPG
jgi:exosortase D (VPLPA-CTERM-specific)